MIVLLWGLAVQLGEAMLPSKYLLILGPDVEKTNYIQWFKFWVMAQS